MLTNFPLRNPLQTESTLPSFSPDFLCPSFRLPLTHVPAFDSWSSGQDTTDAEELSSFINMSLSVRLQDSVENHVSIDFLPPLDAFADDLYENSKQYS